MTTLIAALLPSADVDPDGTVLEALRAAGAARVQVNVDDATTADALVRRSTRDEPMRVVVTVWTEDRDAALAVLAPIADVWEVEEKRRLEPPAAPDGEVESWLSNVAFLRKSAEQPYDEWLAYWMDEHTQIAIDTQETHGYIQNIVVATHTDHPGREAERVTGIVEELFVPEALTSLDAFYGSGGDQEELQRRMTLMGRSVGRFLVTENLDVVPSRRRVYAC